MKQGTNRRAAWSSISSDSIVIFGSLTTVYTRKIHTYTYTYTHTERERDALYPTRKNIKERICVELEIGIQCVEDLG